MYSGKKQSAVSKSCMENTVIPSPNPEASMLIEVIWQKQKSVFHNQLSTKEKQNKGFVVIQDNYIKFFNISNHNLEIQIQITFNLSFKVTREKNSDSLSIPQDQNISAIQFFLQAQNEHILVKGSLDPNLVKFYQLLEKYPIFQLGFDDQYKAIKILNKTNFSKQFLASHCTSEEEFYVKAFNIEWMNEKNEVKQSFQMELKVLKKISHPSIIHLHKVFKTANSIYMIFEKKSLNLHDYVLQNGLPNTEVKKNMLKAVLEGVNYLHEHGIAHRNINQLSICIEELENKLQTTICCFQRCTIFSQNLREKEKNSTYNPNRNQDLKGIGLLMLYLLSENNQLLKNKNWNNLTLNEEEVEGIIPEQNEEVKKLIYQLVSKNKEKLEIPRILSHPFLN